MRRDRQGGTRLSSVTGRLDGVLQCIWAVRLLSAGRDFWSLVFPTECAACTLPTVSLCPECRAQVRKATVRPFRADGGAQALPAAEGCDGGSGDPTVIGALPVTAAGHYRGTVARVLLSYKNHRRTDVGRPLQAALAGALQTAVHEVREGGELGELLLVPVPTRGASVRRRGYDPLGLLLAGLGRRGELPAGCRVDALVVYHGPLKGRPSALPGGTGPVSQKGLGGSQRRINVHASMALATGRQLPPGTLCLVVDDVLTTGATIAEVTRVLRHAGAAVAGAVVVAATPAPSRAR
ncbi:phosphoribosyltransferase family protein [Arthrobacter sp. 260]|uniref:ComF family protein n=1 Tax=Arthrobacter sp. 260 TaxID=2735314 RepID=UPI00149299E4|nr:phosphoribosyltransferase family protein [Arthrobacter sp. 260]NOJ58537.1 ComF family protein [Arthrobacter sp. 260]